MKLIAAAALTALALAMPAQAEPEYTVEQGAFAAAADYLAPLARPDTKRVTINVRYCHKRGSWHGCRVHVRGVSHCNAVIRVRVTGQQYAAWMPRVRCR